jgi:hypothetical protein
MPELVVAPYPVRLMAPTGKEIAIQNDGLVETNYCHHHVTNNDDTNLLQPLLEVTLDLMGNATIRGMASLIKRYLGSMSVDFCIILSKPVGQTQIQEDDEPEACLGLWRLDHVDVSQHLRLPDRFSTDGCSGQESSTDADADAIRARLLVTSARMSSKSLVGVAAG